MRNSGSYWFIAVILSRKSPTAVGLDVPLNWPDDISPLLATSGIEANNRLVNQGRWGSKSLRIKDYGWETRCQPKMRLIIDKRSDIYFYDFVPNEKIWDAVFHMETDDKGIKISQFLQLLKTANLKLLMHTCFKVL